MMKDILTRDEINFLTSIFKEAANKQAAVGEYRYKVLVPFLTSITRLTPLKPYQTPPFPIRGCFEGWPLPIYFCW